MPESGDGAVVRRWCAAGLDALRRHRSEIDALNVYPVPDGDTGTNLALTMAAAVSAVDAAPGTAGAAELLAVAARGALLGARGNSGIILAQLLKGLATSLASVPVVGGAELAVALEGAAKSAYTAVAAPVEGTVLSVATAAARAASSAVAEGASSAAAETVSSVVAEGASSAVVEAVSSAVAGGASSAVAEAFADGDGGPVGVVAVARAAAEGARVALARTPEQLPALARAGVVDAGGRGLVVLLEAFVTSLTGEAPPVSGPVPAAAVAVPGGVMEREAGSVEFGYEVQFLLDAPESAIGPLRDTLGALGDSLVVVGDDPTWHVHVHVNDVGAAIEAGIVAGRPSRIAVTRFAEQIAERHSAGAPDPADVSSDLWGGVAPPVAEALSSGVVVVCSGRGISELLAAEGATVLTGTPSTGEVLAAIQATGAPRVVVLPNDANVLAVANTAAAEARAAGIRAGVVPTRSPVQALAAMAVRDTGRRFEDDVIAMAEAAARCRSAELTVAAREALTVAGRCQRGDVLAIVDGEVNLIGQDLERTACLLLDRMLLAGGELVTLIAGQGAPAGLGETLRGHVAAAWPFVEVQCYEGGQPHYPLLVGVE
ncbi:DAK2 domain-containing protein [Dactylosporangium sp. NPDC049525]|uniref:DAK2 domain-containing protein n=1 Tax=Dactylosporangium sp. NPDC049525 TaxID=3154730 RepID=UPI003417FB24